MNAEKKGKQTNKAVLALAALVVLAAVFFIVYKTMIAKPVSGGKTLTITIEHLDTQPRTISVETDAEYLIGALEDSGIAFEGEESAFGFYMTSLDGYAANEANEEWWGYTKSGEYVETALDQTVISDGDSFEFTLNVGYDF